MSFGGVNQVPGQPLRLGSWEQLRAEAMLVSAWSQGPEAQHGFHYPEFNSPGQPVS